MDTRGVDRIAYHTVTACSKQFGSKNGSRLPTRLFRRLFLLNRPMSLRERTRPLPQHERRALARRALGHERK